jgi:hypothetical protein
MVLRHAVGKSVSEYLHDKIWLKRCLQAGAGTRWWTRSLATKCQCVCESARLTAITERSAMYVGGRTGKLCQERTAWQQNFSFSPDPHGHASYGARPRCSIISAPYPYDYLRSSCRKLVRDVILAVPNARSRP